jgi:hypothetical protein
MLEITRKTAPPIITPARIGTLFFFDDVVLVGESEAFSLGESEARFGTVGTAAADGECEGGNLYCGEV